MADHTHIEWTDATWNPVTGCSIVSPGCTNCYAMRLAGTRLRHHPSRTGLIRDSKAGPVWTGEVRLNHQWLDQPLRWKRPRRIFVCAHGDLFAEGVPDEWIDQVFAVMALAPQHTFQVLTKRAMRMRGYLATDSDVLRERWYQSVPAGKWYVSRAEAYAGIHPDATPVTRALYQRAALTLPLPNVWLGVSAEDQRRADERIPELLATPAAIRFVSAEPLLGPIDFERIGTLDGIRRVMPEILAKEERGRPKSGAGAICGAQIDAVGRAGSSITFFQTPDHMGGFTAASPRQWPRLDWVIVGGESGAGARPMHPDWARSIRDQCAAASVPFFFKQWGEWADVDRYASETVESYDVQGFTADGVIRVGKREAGRLLDGIEHSAFPQVLS